MTSTKQTSIAYRIGAIGLAVLGATLAGHAAAQAAHGAYVGGDIGRTFTDFDNGRAVGAGAGPVTSIGGDEHDTAYKLFGGYQFHPNLALEGGYYNLGRYNYGYTTATGAYNGSTRFDGVNLDLVGTWPVTDRFSVLGRVGAAYTRARTSESMTGTAPAMGSGTERKWGPKLGLGIEYAITQSLAVRGEWERYRVNEVVRGRSDIDVASIGLVYRFGAPAMTRVVAPAPAPTYVPAPAPAPRAYTPPPAPQVAPPPPPAAPTPAPAPAARPYRN